MSTAPANTVPKMSDELKVWLPDGYRALLEFIGAPEREDRKPGAICRRLVIAGVEQWKRENPQLWAEFQAQQKPEVAA